MRPRARHSRVVLDLEDSQAGDPGKLAVVRDEALAAPAQRGAQLERIGRPHALVHGAELGRLNCTRSVSISRSPRLCVSNSSYRLASAASPARDATASTSSSVRLELTASMRPASRRIRGLTVRALCVARGHAVRALDAVAPVQLLLGALEVGVAREPEDVPWCAPIVSVEVDRAAR